MIKGVKELFSQKQKRGLNTTKDIFSLLLGESPAALNVEWTNDGTVKKRLGHTSMNSIVLESSAGYGMYDCGVYYYGIDTATKLLLHANGTQYQDTVTDEIGKTVYHSNSATIIYCSFNGDDGATTYTSDKGDRVATFKGNAQLDTAEKKFGVSSLKLDGTTDYITFPASTDYDLGLAGSGDFTIEGFIYRNNITSNQRIINTYGAAGEGWDLYTNNNFGLYANGADNTLAWAANTLTWYI